MPFLLDTNALLGLLIGSVEFGKETTRRLKFEPDLFVSSLSIAELKIKEMKGKISLPSTFPDLIVAAEVEILDFNADHAIEMGRFGSLANHDPFDRMLLSQASYERFRFIATDRRLVELGLDFVIDAET
jgi:PIN domain nuclease of toxin-antitoxin system